MHSHSLLRLAFSVLLLIPACNFQYSMPTPGYGYPTRLSVLAPRIGNSGNYTYYPRYEAYYHRASKQFYYPNGKNWAVQPTVLGSTPQEIWDSPSVPFQLPDHPSKYHAQIKEAFPSTWTSGQGRFNEPYQFGRSGWDLDRR